MIVGFKIDTKELLEEVLPCLRPLAGRVSVEKADVKDQPALLEWVERKRPQILLLELTRFQNTEDLVRQIKTASPDSMIIALHTTAKADSIIAALRAGVYEYLIPPLASNLRQLLQRKCDQHLQSQSSNAKETKVVGFLSSKGGCGGTTVACHTAVELGRQLHQSGVHQVLLADLDVNGGDIRFLMRSKSPYSVLDAMESSLHLDTKWNQMISNGYPSLEVISTPSGLCPERSPTPQGAEQLLSFARLRYRVTVVDLGCSLTPFVGSILKYFNELYLVATPDVLSLYQVRQILCELRNCSYPAERVHLLLNRSGEYSNDLVSDEAGKMLGVPIYMTLPNDYIALSESYVEGKMLSGASGFGKRIARLASKIGGTEPQVQPQSHLARWRSKLLPLAG